MLNPATLTFYKNIANNNNKPWFDEHRKEYEAAKDDFESVVGDLLQQMTALDPAFAEQKAKDCTYRIYRDVRFSKDKTPYKNHCGAFFARGGKKWEGAGYYLHVEPGKSMAGGGLWMPPAPLLKKVRQEIDYNYDELKAIVAEKKFKKYFTKVNGEALKKAPQGYEEDNPAIDYLKLKSFTVGHMLDDKDLSAKTFVKNVMDIFTAMKPFIDFLNRAID